MPTLSSLLLLRKVLRSQRSLRPSMVVQFPMEIWEFVFQELEDETLLVAARVCGRFNTRCILIYMERCNLSSTALSSGSLRIHSHLLCGLQLSLAALPEILSLAFKFANFGILRSMVLLRQFVRRLPGVTELDIDFGCNLAQAPLKDTIFPYSGYALAKQLGGLLGDVVGRSTGSLFMVCFQAIYEIRPQDISAWKFRYTGYSHITQESARVDRARFARQPDEASPHFFLPVRSASTKRRVLWTPSVLSLAVRAFEQFRLITFDVRELCLPARNIPGHESSASLTQIAEILSHIALPSLETLKITEDIDPTLLRQFLVRHSTIRTILYDVSEWTPQRPTLLFDPPLLLPDLSEIRCTKGEALGCILDSFAPSIGVDTIFLSMTWYWDYEVKAASLRHALRRIALRTEPTRLVIDLRDKDHVRLIPPAHDEDRIIASALTCVWAVYLRVSYVADAQSLIPWLKLLPALQVVELTVRDEYLEPEPVDSDKLMFLAHDPQEMSIHKETVEPLVDELRATFPGLRIIQVRPEEVLWYHGP
ncbi:hypothetical protein C8R43DRAFT_1022360 [Mycena crocata]|nr:hypothetical protein C8R43DRAFT_1022360 [Mycena crocata]